MLYEVDTLSAFVYRPSLQWLLKSPFWWAEVRKYINVGAVFTSLKCIDVPNFTLPIPPLNEQIKISEILYSTLYFLHRLL